MSRLGTQFGLPGAQRGPLDQAALDAHHHGGSIEQRFDSYAMQHHALATSGAHGLPGYPHGPPGPMAASLLGAGLGSSCNMQQLQHVGQQLGDGGLAQGAAPMVALPHGVLPSLSPKTPRELHLHLHLHLHFPFVWDYHKPVP